MMREWKREREEKERRGHVNNSWRWSDRVQSEFISVHTLRSRIVKSIGTHSLHVLFNHPHFLSLAHTSFLSLSFLFPFLLFLSFPSYFFLFPSHSIVLKRNLILFSISILKFSLVKSEESDPVLFKWNKTSKSLNTPVDFWCNPSIQSAVLLSNLFKIRKNILSTVVTIQNEGKFRKIHSRHFSHEQMNPKLLRSIFRRSSIESSFAFGP